MRRYWKGWAIAVLYSGTRCELTATNCLEEFKSMCVPAVCLETAPDTVATLPKTGKLSGHLPTQNLLIQL